MPIAFNSASLVAHIGSRSELAQQLIPELYRQAEQHPVFAAWLDDQSLLLPEKATARAAKHYNLSVHQPDRLLFTLQTYYATIVKWLTAHYLSPIGQSDTIETGHHFCEAGVSNFTERGWLSWYLDTDLNLGALRDQICQFTFEAVPADALKALYQDLLPRQTRHALGEYYTPDWLAEYTLNRVGYHGNGTLLDPTCGSGIFLAYAVQRLQAQGCDDPLHYVAGIDLNPLACLTAKATLLLATGRPKHELSLPIYCADVILAPPKLEPFDFVVGNPPWVNWQTMSQDYREATRSIWERYGLFPHSGMDSILGKGKKDLSLLLTYCAADKYLRVGGKLGFVITQSALKSQGAGDGFRRFCLPDVPLSVLHVDDLSRIRPFDGASTRAAVLILEKGRDTVYPVPYVLWNKSKKGINLSDLSLEQVDAVTKQVEFVAEPHDAIYSQWLTGKPAAIRAVRKLLGPSDYQAHAGVYTGGANGVYWLELLGETDQGLYLRNIIESGKRVVPQVEAILEPDLVYPLLRGTDVKRWHATPSTHILLTQDVEKRRGYDWDWLQVTYPRTAAYLVQFEPLLRSRAAFKRYFRTSSPFYSMFNIGTYSLAPYKVVWNGMGKQRMEAAVVSSRNGKPILSNQAMHPFIGVYNEDEAHYLAACLNSLPFDYAVVCHTQVGGKSFAQPGILNVLRIPQYQASLRLHQQMTALSRSSHLGKPDAASLTHLSAQLWGLSEQEVKHVRDSLIEWH